MDAIAQAAVRLFRSLSDSAALIEVLDDRDDVRVLAVNPALAKQFDASPDQLAGRLGSELYPPAELTDVVRRAREVLADEQTRTYEAARELPDGRVVVVASMVAVGPNRVVVHGRDESARAEAVRQLAAIEGLANIGSWTWNLETNSLWLSPQHRRILGWGPDEPASIERIAASMHPDDRDRVVGRMQLTSTGRDEVGGATYRIVRPDGNERVVHGTGELVSDDDGRPIRMFGTTQDITEQARAEEDRRRLERALEHQQQALELNDNVVQGLAAAWLAFELGEIDEGIALVQRTTGQAQDLVNALLRDAAADEPLNPGDLARRTAANVDGTAAS